MRTPAVPLAILYAAGLVLGDWLPLPWKALVTACGGLLLAVLVISTRQPESRLSDWLLATVLVLMGWTGITLSTAILSPIDLRRQTGEEPVLAAVRGRVADLPQERVYLRGEEERWRTMVTVQVDRWRTNETWEPARGKIAVTMQGQFENPVARGDYVEITGVLSPPPGPLAPGMFDYRQYLRRQGIYFQFRTEGMRDWTFPNGNRGANWEQRFVAWAQQALARGLPETDLNVKLLWNMTLGTRAGLTNDAFVPFARAGTQHIFAISGLHIALIALIITTILRSFLPRQICGSIVLPLIWAYTAATGWQPSAVRSAIMSSVVLAGWMFARPHNLVNSLAAAAFLILLWDPQQLFQASFQLSFLAVLSMTLIIPRLEQARDQIVHHDPMLAEDAIPWWRRRVLNSFRWGTTYGFTSLGAWLGTLPLTAWYFHLFSPVSLLANMLAVPASSAALACNLGSLALAWWPWMAELLNYSAWFWMEIMLRVSHWAANTSWGWMHVPSPSAGLFLGYYGALGLLLGTDHLSERWRRVMQVVMVGGFVLCGWDFLRATSEARVTVLPLSGGTSILVDPGEGAGCWLVDCGRSNAVRSVVSPVLRAHGVNRLPRLALSHGDIQDMGGALEICAEFDPREVWLTAQRHRSPVYRLVTSTLSTNGASVRTVGRGDHIDGWQVVHPEPGVNYSRADDGALCLRREVNGVRLLLLPDLGTAGQQSLATSGQDLRAEVVIAGLPAEGEPLRSELLQRIQPQGVVISDSLFPATERVSRRTRARLSASGCQVWYGSDVGALQILITQGKWKVVNAQGIAVEPQEIRE